MLAPDTPGLLNRMDADRNKMEMLTLSVLQYLPTSVVFVVSFKMLTLTVLHSYSTTSVLFVVNFKMLTLAVLH
jgi:hypothetical protein